MFTGLVQTVGRVKAVDSRRDVVRLAVESSLAVEEMTHGESVSVDGVCLSVVERAGNRFSSDVIPETLQRSTLSELKPGASVNLERALRLGDRLGGHLVQGHVDTAARLVSVERDAGDYRLRVELLPAIRRYIAQKGSVAVQGVSLTVAALRDDEFEVALTPDTLARTNLGHLRCGDRVNVEVDLVARYLESLVGTCPGE